MLPDAGGSTFSSSFSNIDAAADPTDFVRFMDDANSMEFCRSAKERTFTLLALQVGNRVLDVGCGTGDDVRALAQIVGPTGRGVGLDSSQTMIEAARRRAAGQSAVEFHLGDARRRGAQRLDRQATSTVVRHCRTARHRDGRSAEPAHGLCAHQRVVTA
jgi:SAM-dependent methyltransferase